MKVEIGPGSACWVTLREESAFEGEGPYIDLKAEPGRVGELPEAVEWPALGAFIAQINRLPDLQTAGSKAVGETPGGLPDPFVDVAFASPPYSESGGVSRVLQEAFESLDGIDTAGDFVLEVWGSETTFPSGAVVKTARLWLRGSRAQAEEAFPVIIGFLAAQRAEMYRNVPAELDDLNDDDQPSSDAADIDGTNPLIGLSEELEKSRVGDAVKADELLPP